MEIHHSEEERYLSTQKQVKKLKGFYWHFFWYLAVNIWLLLQIANYEVFDADGLKEVFFHIETYSTMIYWGIGIFFHAVNVFGKRMTFSSDWEKRKIKEFMDKDTRND